MLSSFRVLHDGNIIVCVFSLSLSVELGTSEGGNHEKNSSQSGKNEGEDVGVSLILVLRDRKGNEGGRLSERVVRVDPVVCWEGGVSLVSEDDIELEEDSLELNRDVDTVD